MGDGLLQPGRAQAKLGDRTHAKRHLEEALKLDQQEPVFTAVERTEVNQLIQGSNGKG